MFLAGVNLSNDALLELARLVNGEELADRLEETYGSGVHVLGLTNVERETILRALDDPPDSLVDLRAALIREHVARVRDGLV